VFAIASVTSGLSRAAAGEVIRLIGAGRVHLKRRPHVRQRIELRAGERRRQNADHFVRFAA